MLMTIRVPEGIVGLKFIKANDEGYMIDETVTFDHIVEVKEEKANAQDPGKRVVHGNCEAEADAD